MIWCTIVGALSGAATALYGLRHDWPFLKSLLVASCLTVSLVSLLILAGIVP
jgi:hypothetical protein